MRPGVLEQSIIDLRKDGLSCRETAERLEIKEYRVWRCMSRHGLAGQLRCKHNRVSPKCSPQAALKRALETSDVLTIERGLMGGYLVTLDDTWQGKEMETIPGAVRSALEAK